MAPEKGLEPLTFWLTARRSTIELPRNTTPLHMVGIEPTVYALSGRCFTCKLIRSCCAVYTTKHPWCVRSFTTVYKCRMVTRGGIEPTVLAVKERCLNHLTNGPCVTPILTRKPLCGGECGIRTHGTFLFDSFQDCCINPDSANSPCNSPIKSCTL